MNSSVKGFCLTVVIPCFNSESYMHTAVDSVLAANSQDVEIIIVNDGSRDETGQIADQYAASFPEQIQVIHQENRGHGGAVNTGIRTARGSYLKVLDSDDWFDASAFKKVISVLREFQTSADPVDLLVSNYVYEKQGAAFKMAIRYNRVFPKNRKLVWSDTDSLRPGQYLMMHSLTYRTEVLRRSGLELPEHTFYVDNLFVNVPLRHVHSLYYLDVNLYRYFIGRNDQSVNEAVMIKRIDQQLLVNGLVVDNYLQNHFPERKLSECLFHHVEIVTAISSILLIRSGTREHLEKKAALWKLIRMKDEKLYKRLRRRFFGIIVHLPGAAGRKLAVTAYRMSRLVFGFN